MRWSPALSWLGAACVVAVLGPLSLAAHACRQDAGAAGDDAGPHAGADQLIRVDRQKREVRVLCEALRVEMPLEFFCVVAGTADHESVLRTRARPSDVHAALLGLGLEPGSPLRFVPERKEWLAPHGPPLRVEVEWQQDGRTIRRRAGELMRNMNTGAAMPPHPWVFVGSRIINDTYGADATGQLVTLVNFEFSTIDVPRIASNANETLEWEINPDTMPPEGAAVWMILTAIDDDEGGTTRPATTREAAARRGIAASPVEVVVVALNEAGEVSVNHEPVALAEAGRAVRDRVPEEAARAAVRLTAPRGAPVDVLGRLFAALAEAELTDVTFIAPETARAARGGDGQDEAADPPDQGIFDAGNGLEVLVYDGGSEVSLGGSPRRPLGEFVANARSAASRQPGAPGGGGGMPPGPQSVLVRPAAEAGDVKPIDIAAVHALLHVLGHRVRAEYPAGAGEAGAAGVARDAALAELRARWERDVLPQAAALREAAQTHYEVMEAYQREINRLLDEADRLRREMDALQQRYNELTTPRPESPD